MKSRKCSDVKLNDCTETYRQASKPPFEMLPFDLIKERRRQKLKFEAVLHRCLESAVLF